MRNVCCVCLLLGVFFSTNVFSGNHLLRVSSDLKTDMGKNCDTSINRDGSIKTLEIVINKCPNYPLAQRYEIKCVDSEGGNLSPCQSLANATGTHFRATNLKVHSGIGVGEVSSADIAIEHNVGRVFSLILGMDTNTPKEINFYNQVLSCARRLAEDKVTHLTIQTGPSFVSCN